MRGVVYRGLAGFDTGVNLRESVDLDALGTDFRISGLQLEFFTVALTENFQGRLAKVYFGALSLGAPPGLPRSVSQKLPHALRHAPRRDARWGDSAAYKLPAFAPTESADRRRQQ